MYARAVEESAQNLRALHYDELGLAALTGLSFAGALAFHGNHMLAVALLCAALVGLALGVRAMWRHWNLLEELLEEPDAYTIEEVRRRATALAGPKSRRALAFAIRRRLEHSEPLDELARLAADLENETLTLDPVCAAACKHLVDEGLETLDADLAVARARRIRAGFST